jgi:CCR4-NOT transcription complex subunit 6
MMNCLEISLSISTCAATSRRVDAAHPELATDPFGILRPPSKLQHPLPLVSAYTALTKQPCLEAGAYTRSHFSST